VADQVRAGVADNLQPFFILGGDDLQRSVLFDKVTGVNQAPIYFAGNGGFGQTSANRLGYISNGNGMIEGTLTAVRESNSRHDATPAQW
jgi:hypothetical protein